MDFILRPFTEVLLCVKNDLGMNLVKFVTMVMVMLKKMGFSMEMMRTRKGFCEKAIVIVWHLVPASSQLSAIKKHRHWHSWKFDGDHNDSDDNQNHIPEAENMKSRGIKTGTHENMMTTIAITIMMPVMMILVLTMTQRRWNHANPDKKRADVGMDAPSLKNGRTGS